MLYKKRRTRGLQKSNDVRSVAISLVSSGLIIPSYTLNSKHDAQCREAEVPGSGRRTWEDKADQCVYLMSFYSFVFIVWLSLWTQTRRRKQTLLKPSRIWPDNGTKVVLYCLHWYNLWQCICQSYCRATEERSCFCKCWNETSEDERPFQWRAANFGWPLNSQQTGSFFGRNKRRECYSDNNTTL